MKKHIRITAGFLMLIATLTGCVKGDTGATGAQGAQGATGLTGAQGNANVEAGTITISGSNWTYNSTNADYYCDITDSAITADLVANGTVEVFYQLTSAPSWETLPFTVSTSSSSFYTITYDYYLNGVTLYINISNLNTYTWNSQTYKIVAIGGAQRKAHPNTNWNDYASIKAALGEQLVETTVTARK